MLSAQVGDPATSKSQMLQFVHKIAPRGIYTSGKGSSAVGLTAFITRDPETRESVLESGALVRTIAAMICATLLCAPSCLAAPQLTVPVRLRTPCVNAGAQ